MRKAVLLPAWTVPAVWNSARFTPQSALYTVRIIGGTVAIGEGATPPEVVVATNSEGSVGYAPPCPSKGERRQFLLTVFAMDKVIDLAAVTGASGGVDAELLLTEIEMSTFDLAESTFYVQAP